jgi:hypothetical protein
MKEKTRYTDEPMRVGRVLRDFLPPPEKLVLQDESVKVTISLSARSVRFFKAEAAKVGGQYQRMIRSALDAYAAAFEPAAAGRPPHDGSSNRLEQARPRYGRAARPATKRFAGSDKRPGDVARRTKKLMHKDFRGK